MDLPKSGMTDAFRTAYDHIRSGGSGFYEQKRGLIAVWGKEAVQFLDGMITNDMKTLEDGQQMLAAFPNAQGRLLAVVRILRQGDRFLIETEEATREKLFETLFRFTFAGDFFVEDISDNYSYFEIFGPVKDVYNSNVDEHFKGALALLASHGADYFMPAGHADEFRVFLSDDNGCADIGGALYETLRIESGVPKYGVDMDETTIVPELGLDGMISYTKGCYVGQEIIARIHFRGHVAKRLTGLIFGTRTSPSAENEIADMDVRVPGDGKNAGRITSITFSPKLDKTIALGYIRYDYLAEGTELVVDGTNAVVTALPFTSSTPEEKIHAQN